MAKTFYGITDGYEFERLLGKEVTDVGKDVDEDITILTFSDGRKEVSLMIDLYNNELSITQETEV